MKKPVKLSNTVVDILMPLLASEFTAFYHYRNLANYCTNVGFFKAAKFFEAEAQAELDHAKGIEKFLTDWNVSFTLPSIASPKPCNGLVEGIDQSYDLETNLYIDHENSGAKLFQMGEMQTFDFLAKYRQIQQESVAEYSDMLNILEGCKTEDKFQLLMLEETLFGG